MKKTIISALALIGCVCFFTACEDDRDSNPTLLKPSSFELNTPAYATSEIDLKTSKELHFTCSQPDYGYTAATVYNVELSLSNSFTVSVEAAEAAEDGSLTPDYVTVDESYTTCTIATDASLFSKALQQLAKWKEDAVPASQIVNVRMTAKVGNQTTTSNTVDIKVVPYYIELSDAPVEMWYLIGSCIGDGKWSNSMNAIGTSLYPMAIVKDYEYDKKTGQGELTFTGYLTPDGFKLIRVPGDWNDQWGMNDGSPVKNDGGSGNITVPEAGYYTLTLNTKDNKLNIEKVEITPKVYDAMCITGAWAGESWPDVEMTPVNTVIPNNHIWSYALDATSGDTEAKFKIAGSWDTNWGGDAFPNGIGSNGGANIPVKAGKYIVTFNDIDGSYTFTVVE